MKRTYLLVTLLYVAISVWGQTYTVKSPDGNIEAGINTDKELSLKIRLHNKVLLDNSVIDLLSADGKGIYRRTKVTSNKLKTIRETIDAPFYRQKSFDNTCDELNLEMQNGFGIILRAYNDGVAYRFYTTIKGKTIIKNEVAGYKFGRNRKAWLSYTTNDEKPMAMAFQNVYDNTSLDSAKHKLAFLPATIDCGEAKITLLESDIVSYPGMWVKTNGDGLDASFAPYPKKMEYYPWRHMSHVTDTCDYIAVSKGARTYPWRIFAITEKDTDMPVNNLVYALARANRTGDTSWIKPGKVAWDWWNDWNLKGVDFKAGINYDTYKYYIDFAAAHKLQYIVLDEGWYDSQAGTMLKPIDDIRLPELISYAKNKGVGIVLWSVFNVMDENLETICKHYKDIGIAGFKVDFMDRNDQTAYEMVERLAKCTAKHKLILDLHGIYTPAGLNRTYPNVLNYESVFGMEESRWTTMKDHDMPMYDVTFPYIRLMSGQVDFTPGAMHNGTKDNWKAIYTKPISMGTRCHQAACYVVQDGPFAMLADSPTNYEVDETYTHFIADIPVVFSKTIIPQGEIGKYIVTAREENGNWYIAGQTNWDERDIKLTFNFLKAGTNYDATLLRDGINANHDAEDYKLEKVKICKDSELNVHLASGGGFVLKLTSIK